jgi:hypothetical protein
MNLGYCKHCGGKAFLVPTKAQKDCDIKWLAGCEVDGCEGFHGNSEPCFTSMVAIRNWRGKNETSL